MILAYSLRVATIQWRTDLKSILPVFKSTSKWEKKNKLFVTIWMTPSLAWPRSGLQDNWTLERARKFPSSRRELLEATPNPNIFSGVPNSPPKQYKIVRKTTQSVQVIPLREQIQCYWHSQMIHTLRTNTLHCDLDNIHNMYLYI